MNKFFRKKIYVLVKWTHQCQFIPFYAAVEAGLYAKKGLNVSITDTVVDPEFDPIALVEGGEVDFAVVGAPLVIKSCAEGKRIRAVAGIFSKTPLTFFFDSSTEISSPTDLAGHSVVIERGHTSIKLEYRMCICEAGLNHLAYSKPYQYFCKMSPEERSIIAPKIITEATTGGETLMSLRAFLGRKVDVGVGYDFNEFQKAQRTLGAENVESLRPRDFGVECAGDTLITSVDMIKSERDRVQAFVDATLDGAMMALEEGSEAKLLDYARCYNKDHFERDHELFMLRDVRKYLRPTGTSEMGLMNPATWKGMQQTMLRHGMIETSSMIDQVVDGSFAQRYHAGRS